MQHVLCISYEIRRQYTRKYVPVVCCLDLGIHAIGMDNIMLWACSYTLEMSEKATRIAFFCFNSSFQI